MPAPGPSLAPTLRRLEFDIVPQIRPMYGRPHSLGLEPARPACSHTPLRLTMPTSLSPRHTRTISGLLRVDQNRTAPHTVSGAVVRWWDVSDGPSTCAPCMTFVRVRTREYEGETSEQRIVSGGLLRAGTAAASLACETADVCRPPPVSLSRAATCRHLPWLPDSASLRQSTSSRATHSSLESA